MRSNLGVALPFMLAVVSSAVSKLVFVSFNDPRIVYDSHWTLQPSSKGSNVRGTATQSISPGSTSQDVCSQLITGPGDAGATISNFPGASFTFQFTGISASILTTSGSGVASYSVIRDNNTTTSLLAPSVLASSDCHVTYETARLPQDGTTHTLTVTVDSVAVPGAEMRVLGIVYDDAGADNLSTPKSGDKPAGLFIGIAVASGMILLLILLCTLYWCRRQTRAPLYVEQEDGTAARRVLATRKALGILSSTPTFLQHDDTKKYKTHVRLMSDELTMSETGISQSKSSGGFSGFTLLRPPVPPKLPRPALDMSNNRLQVPVTHRQTHSRTQSTTAGTVLTSFSV